jgi:hypothetical protein
MMLKYPYSYFACGTQMKNSTILASELERLKGLLNLGHELEVKWIPSQKYSHSRQISGEVLNGTIFVYEEDKAKAISTMYHEYLDYLTSELIIPYQELINLLISLFEDQAYRRKEKLVERLCNIIFEGDAHDTNR